MRARLPPPRVLLPHTCVSNARPPPPTHTPPPHTGFPMSAHLSSYASFSDICGACFGFRSGFGIGFTLLLARSFTRSSSSCHPPFTQYPFPSRPLLRDGQTSPHTFLGSSYLIVHVLHCPPPPPAHSFIIGRSCSNKHNSPVVG
jgi:hypothetical protein